MNFNKTLLPSDSNINIESLNSLARLLATEDINIVHSGSATTASFETNSRTLTLPAWDGLSKAIYHLFTGHEVGHALFTPTDGFTHSSIPKEKNTSGFRSILNCTEDVRIEKKVKRKYPGIRVDFTEGYKSLLDVGFFGESLAELNSTGNIADRLNVRWKIGSLLGASISFDDGIEKDFLERGYALESFEDSVELAVAIYDHLVDEGDPGDGEPGNGADVDGEPGNGEPGNGEAVDGEPGDGEPGNDKGNSDTDNGDSDSDDGDSDDGSDSGSDDGSDSDGSDAGGDEDGDDSSGAAGDTKPKKDGGNDGTTYDPSAKTDEASRTNAEDLVNPDAKETLRLTVPHDRVDHNHYVHPTKKILEEFDAVISGALYVEEEKIAAFNSVLRAESTKYVNSCKPVVAYLAKEFEMKKAADEHRRSSTARTGVIDVGKLHSYKYNEDVFLKKAVNPSAKNHGLVMFIDMSGSMSDNLEGTLEQLINLVLFCKKVSIPFEVYGINDGYSPDPDITSRYITGDILVDPTFYLRKFVSSELGSRDFKRAIDYLFWMKCYFNRYNSRYNEGTPASLRHYYVSIADADSLGSTPLNDAIIAGMGIVKDFRKKTGVQICNVVFLTDGESNPLDSSYDAAGGDTYRENASGISNKSPSAHIVIHDEKTRKVKAMNSSDPGSINYWWETGKEVTSFLLDVMKSACDVKIAGFFLIPGSPAKARGELANILGHHGLTGRECDEVDAAWNDVKKNGVYVTGAAGYDVHFAIRGGSSLNTDEESVLEGVADDAKDSQIRAAFKKGSKKKIKSRVLLTKFIDLIA